MMKTFANLGYLAFGVLFLTITISDVKGQYMGQVRGKSDKGFAVDFPIDRKKRPDLAENYDGIAELKITSFKQKYRLGEIMKIDAALLNKSKKPIFFHKFWNSRIYLIQESAKTESVTYLVVDRALSNRNYLLVEPAEYYDETFDILLGCPREAFDAMNQRLSAESSQKAFEQGLFVNWGDACLPVNSVGEYLVELSVLNNRVALPTNKSKIKTAVGTLKSNSLKISVVN